MSDVILTDVGNVMEPPTSPMDQKQGNLPTVAALPPLLLRTSMAAALCGLSVRTWRMLDAAGRIPKPIHIGRTVFWRPDELRAWVAAGCPKRQEWETMQS